MQLSLEYFQQRCTWCKGTMPPGKRSDADTCSQPCRQAKHRFRVAPGELLEATEPPMRFCYADPPYPGLARKYYACVEVDHRELVNRLVHFFPDGWALSTSAPALQEVLALCPPRVRVCPWVRGARPTKARRALNAWEPLIVCGGRPRREAVAEDLCDTLLWGGRQHSHPGALVGMKPAAFCEWMFRLLGARRGDELVDMFPGSGAVYRAWQLFQGGDVARDTSPAAAAEPTRSTRATLPSRLAGASRRLLAVAAGGRGPRGET